MAHRHLSEEEIQILKHEFEQYDQDNGGNITVEEFGRVMKASGQNPTDEELQQIIKEVDLDGDGTINFDEFIAMMTGRPRSSPSAPAPAAPATGPVQAQSSAEQLIGHDGDTESDLKAAWKEFDPSLKSSITAAQFRQVMAGLGENVSDVEIDELMGTVDAADKISYKEFVEFVKTRQLDDIVGGY